VVAHAVCARVRGYVLERDGVRHVVGASVGVVAIDGRFLSVAEVVAAADAACYEAKRAGRDAVRTWRGPDTAMLGAVSDSAAA
jgi:PleD family two-component response regulator